MATDKNKKLNSKDLCLKMIEFYEVPLDVDIKEAIAQAINISRKKGIIVRFTFNQIEMNINVPKIKSKENIDYYQQYYTDEYRGKLSQKKIFQIK